KHVAHDHPDGEPVVSPSARREHFLDGLGFPVPVNFPGGVGPVTWSGRFAVDQPGVKVTWHWAAAVYTSFSTNNNALGVKPVDDGKASAYKNSEIGRASCRERG